MPATRAAVWLLQATVLPPLTLPRSLHLPPPTPPTFMQAMGEEQICAIKVTGQA